MSERIDYRAVNKIRSQRKRPQVKDARLYSEPELRDLVERINNLYDEIDILDAIIYERAYAEKQAEQSRDIEIIDMGTRSVTCVVCGKETNFRQGIPVSQLTALIVPNDYQGPWGGVPVCPICKRRHEGGELDGEDTRY